MLLAGNRATTVKFPTRQRADKKFGIQNAGINGVFARGVRVGMPAFFESTFLNPAWLLQRMT